MILVEEVVEELFSLCSGVDEFCCVIESFCCELSCVIRIEEEETDDNEEEEFHLVRVKRRFAGFVECFEHIIQKGQTQVSYCLRVM